MMKEDTAILSGAGMPPGDTVYLSTEPTFVGEGGGEGGGVRGRVRRYLEGKPTLWTMNLLTFVTGIFLFVAVFLGLLASFSLLRWTCGLLLLFASLPT